MANGRGCVDCRECKHHYFHRDPPESPTGQMMCGLWKVALPRMRYVGLNMFCKAHEAAAASAHILRGFRDFEQQMEDDILYAVFYNDDASRMKKVLDLRTRKFVDGHPDSWEAGLVYP